MKRGLTFLEAMLVLSLLSIIVAIGSSLLFKNRRIQTELDSSSQVIADILRRAQNNAITGEGFTTWGVRFDNGTTDFYQMFSGANWTRGTRYEYFSLPSRAIFSVPGEGANTEILFDVRTGRRTSLGDSITVHSSTNPSLSKTIFVSAEGNINVK